MTKVPSIFADPWVLSLLLAMPALTVVQIYAAWRNRQLLRRLGDPLTVTGLLPTRRRFGWLAIFLFGSAMSALVMGAAGPRWGQDPHPEVVAGRDLVVLLDMSNSMRAADAPPDRFRRAVESVKILLDYVRRRGGHRLALVAFAADAQVVCPLTYDYDHVQMKLESLDLDHPPPGLRAGPAARSGTRIGAGLRAAVAAHEPEPKLASFQDILLLSDGDDPETDGEWEAGLREVQPSGIPIFVVGIGDADRDAEIAVPGRDERVKTRLAKQPLQEIARRTAGQFLLAGIEMPRLDDLFRQRIESKGATMPVGDVPPLPYPRQVWFYAAALLLIALAAVVRFPILGIGWRVREPQA